MPKTDDKKLLSKRKRDSGDQKSPQKRLALSNGDKTLPVNFEHKSTASSSADVCSPSSDFSWKGIEEKMGVARHQTLAQKMLVQKMRQTVVHEPKKLPRPNRVQQHAGIIRDHIFNFLREQKFLHALSNIYTGKYEQALNYLQFVYNVCPDAWIIPFFNGEIFLQQNKIAQAKESYNTALSKIGLLQNVFTIRMNLPKIRLYQLSGNLDEAILDMRRFYDDTYTNAPVYILRILQDLFTKNLQPGKAFNIERIINKNVCKDQVLPLKDLAKFSILNRHSEVCASYVARQDILTNPELLTALKDSQINDDTIAITKQEQGANPDAPNIFTYIGIANT